MGEASAAERPTVIRPKRNAFLAAVVLAALLGAYGEGTTPAPAAPPAAPPATVLSARSFGTVGDGLADDGPAIGRMMQAAGNKNGVSFAFDKNRVYRIKTPPGDSPWVFTWAGRTDVTFDGGGSVFLLDPAVRFMKVERCVNVTVRNLAVDYDPLPFAEGTVIAKDPVARTLDVRIAAGFALPPLGGPTREREQSYFAMLWLTDATGRRSSAHYSVEDMTEASPGSLRERIVRVSAGKSGGHVPDFGAIVPGETRITLPVRGVAHRMAAAPNGHVTLLLDENKTLLFEDIAIWSAPLFAAGVLRNEGACTFRRFNIQPKPNSGRVTSSWRDGFHVKGNRAKLLWEDCRLEGMNDDAFNISTHAAGVTKVLSEKEWVIRQIYPLNVMDYRPGDTVLIVDDERGTALGRAKVLEGGMPPMNERGYAQDLRIKVDAPVAGVRKGCRLWNETASNPGAAIRRCQVFMSCRFQSPDLLIESCEFNTLAWFYGEYVEGPMPVRLTAKDTRFTVGRGNAQRAVIVGGRLRGKAGQAPVPEKPIIEYAGFLNCQIAGELVCEDVAAVDLTGTRFIPPRGRFVETRCGKVTARPAGK